MTGSTPYQAPWRYWLRVFALYALAEACIQLLLFFTLNNFGARPISLPEFHGVMWCFQCLLIWPIWGVAWLLRRRRLWLQLLANTAFYVVYTGAWFGPVQDAVGYVYDGLVQFTRLQQNRLPAYLDRGNEHSYLNYQLLKHAYRLSWFFLAAYFYNYRAEEKKRLELAVANRALQLKLLKWHLNPSFYFKTIRHLEQVAAQRPADTTGPILQLARVMEYVIYEAKEKLIAVPREVQFISNYIQLLNAQPGAAAVFEFTATGRHDHLKIAPLLLTDIIDAASQWPQKTACRIHFEFTGCCMLLQVWGGGGPLKPQASFFERLQELYPGRHGVTLDAGGHYLQLNLTLDDA